MLRYSNERNNDECIISRIYEAFVDEWLTGDGYGSASEYVRDLIRSYQKRIEQEKLEKLFHITFM